MRVLFGLAALAAVASSVDAVVQFTVDNGNGVAPLSPPTGVGPFVKVFVYYGTTIANSNLAVLTPATNLVNNLAQEAYISTSNFGIAVPSTQTILTFKVTTNEYVGQLQHRWDPDYTIPSFPSSATKLTYTCDACAPNCGVLTGPGSTGAAGVTSATGFPCARLTRTYTMAGITNTAVIYSFSVQQFDIQASPAPNTASVSFAITKYPPPIVGDPAITGIQGQDFQVHGVPDEIFNMITSPSLQVNARFVYLSDAECHDNFTACFAHPGTYISEEGIRVGHDKVHVKAGSYKKGLTVKINGQKLTKPVNELKLGRVELINHRRVVITTPVASVQISNSDKFLNQETSLTDDKLVELGKQRRKLLVGESFHSEVPLHGLQGQTWRNVEYPSGNDYEGTVADYMIADGNLFGTQFVFNKFKIN